MRHRPLSFATATPHQHLSRRQFFFEEALPAEASNLRHVAAPVQKLGIVIEAIDSWEGHHASIFGGTLLQLDNGRYRLYYSGYVRGMSEFWLAIAESVDGVTWEKPALGQVIVDSQDTNRLAIHNIPSAKPGSVQPQVLRLPSGEWRMYFWHHHPHGHDYYVARSTDGLHWQVDEPVVHPLNNAWLGEANCLEAGWFPGSGNPSLAPEAVAELWRKKALRTNDANFVYHNPLLDRYECFSPWITAAIPDRRVEVDNCPGVHRLMQRRLSADGLAWGPPELIVRPDRRDPWDLQFYHMAVQWHEDWQIGSLGHYRVEDGQQTQDLELAFSRDGREWHRPLRGGFIPRAEAPLAPDSAGIYPANAWIDEGDTWLGLYTGTPFPHNRNHLPDDPRKVTIMAARWGKNRFVGLGADRVTGGFTSKPFAVQGDTITIDAEIHGWLRAELCDVFGRKLPGYHLMDSLPVQGDSSAHVLRWKDRSTAGFRHDLVRLRFEFADGSLFSIGF
jgi:hypothetical protein